MEDGGEGDDGEEWVEICEDTYQNVKTKLIHKCTRETCDTIVETDNSTRYDYCEITAKMYEKMDDVELNSVILKTSKRAKVDKSLDKKYDNIERSLRTAFDDFFKKSMELYKNNVSELYRVFLNRLEERKVDLKDESVHNVLKNFEFTTTEKDYWITFAMNIIKIYVKDESINPSAILFSILFYASTPDGLRTNSIQRIHPDTKVMLRYPVKDEKKAKNIIKSGYITKGTKFLKMSIDWSQYNTNT